MARGWGLASLHGSLALPRFDQLVVIVIFVTITELGNNCPAEEGSVWLI